MWIQPKTAMFGSIWEQFGMGDNYWEYKCSLILWQVVTTSETVTNRHSNCLIVFIKHPLTTSLGVWIVQLKWAWPCPPGTCKRGQKQIISCTHWTFLSPPGFQTSWPCLLPHIPGQITVDNVSSRMKQDRYWKKKNEIGPLFYTKVNSKWVKT